MCQLSKTYWKQKFYRQNNYTTRLILVPNCVVCGKKKSGFIKSQEVHSKIDLIKFKINKIITVLVKRSQFMHKLQLIRPGFTFSPYGSFSKHREMI